MQSVERERAGSSKLRDVNNKNNNYSGADREVGVRGGDGRLRAVGAVKDGWGA